MSTQQPLLSDEQIELAYENASGNTNFENTKAFVRAIEAAATEAHNAALVERAGVMPEPSVKADPGTCCGCPTTGAEYMGQREELCCGNPDGAHPALYEESQLQEVIAAMQAKIEKERNENIRLRVELSKALGMDLS